MVLNIFGLGFLHILKSVHLMNERVAESVGEWSSDIVSG